jgi:hypothetical protein
MTREAVRLYQREFTYKENKPVGRLCKMCNPLFYEFRVDQCSSSSGVLTWVYCCYGCTAATYTTEATR